MSQSINLFSRRAVLATLGGGGTIAVAVAAPKLIGSGPANAGFQSNFRSPFASLTTGDHNMWRAAIGSTVQVTNGPSLRVAGVETFAPFGKGAKGTSRKAAFMVKFEVVGGSPLPGDMIYDVVSPTQGSMQLFLTRPINAPQLVQAMFS